MWLLSVGVDVSWETFLLFNLSWRFGFATQLIIASTFLLLVLSLWVSCSQYAALSGVADLGTSNSKPQSSLIIQPQAITGALVSLVELGAWTWVKQTRWRRTATPGEELGQASSRLPRAPTPSFAPRSSHRLTMSQGRLPGLCRAHPQSASSPSRQVTPRTAHRSFSRAPCLSVDLTLYPWRVILCVNS